MPFIAAKSLMLVRNTPTRTTSSKLLPAAVRTAERFWKRRSVSAAIPPATSFARRRVSGALPVEIDEPADVNGLGKRAHRRCEFRRGNCGLAHGKLLWTVGSMVRTVEPEVAPASKALWASGILERKTLIDVNAHIP